MENNNQIAIYSRNHLLGYHLALKFAEAKLKTLLTHLPPSEPKLKTLDGNISQESYSPEKIILPADYLLLIYPTLSDLTLVNRLAQSAMTTNAKLCVIINYRDLRLIQSIRAHLPEHLNYRFVVVTDPYGPYFDDGHDPLSQLITSATQKNSLVVTDGGKLDLYPTYVGDLTPQILKTIFTSGTGKQTFWLSTLEPVKNLDVAYKLVNLSAEVLENNLEIAVSDDRTPTPDLDSDAIANAQNQLSWEPTTDLEDGLRQALQVAAPKVETQTKAKPLPKPKVDLAKLPPIERKVRRFFNPKAWLIITFLVGIATLIGLPLILFVINSYLGVTHLSGAMKDLQQGSTQSSHNLAQQATADFGRSRVLLQSGAPLLWFVPDKTITQTDKLLDALSRLSVVLTTGSDTVGQAEELYQIILGGSNGDFALLVSQLKSSLDSLYSELSLVKVSLEKVDLNNNLEFFNTLTESKKQLPEMLSQLQLGLSSLDLLPQLIGGNSPQTYLVILQDSAELRPTGGFIGSYALVTFLKGRLTDIKVNDTYSADAQLSGHVDPPEPIKKYLGETNWYLRDANWYASFPNSARQIQWFVGKELNRDVQGVVAMNLFTIQDLLQATGPLTVPEFNEVITADNLFERTRTRSEVNFYPGSDQKHDFFTALNSQLFQNLKSGRVPLAKLASSFDHSLKGRQLLLMSTNPQVETSLESIGWSGSVKNQPCPAVFSTSPCTNSTFALIEANLGVNKANSFLDRQLVQNVQVEPDGRINYQINVGYKNNSSSTAWPGGRYKTFTRLYVPIGTDLVSANFNGAELIPEATIPMPELGLTEISMYYEVPNNETAELKISLRGDQILATKSPSSSLAINWIKQSGTGEDPIAISINYPQGLAPAQLNLPADSQPQQLNVSTLLKGNLTFAVQFRKL